MRSQIGKPEIIVYRDHVVVCGQRGTTVKFVGCLSSAPPSKEPSHDARNRAPE